MSDTSTTGGIDPALADAVHSIRATHEDESPRGQEPDAATDATGVAEATEGADPSDADAPGSTDDDTDERGVDHG